MNFNDLYQNSGYPNNSDLPRLYLTMDSKRIYLGNRIMRMLGKRAILFGTHQGYNYKVEEVIQNGVATYTINTIEGWISPKIMDSDIRAAFDKKYGRGTSDKFKNGLTEQQMDEISKTWPTLPEKPPSPVNLFDENGKRFYGEFAGWGVPMMKPYPRETMQNYRFDVAVGGKRSRKQKSRRSKKTTKLK